MTLGGFEKNPELHQNYFNRPYIYPLGSDMNTGDGIYMCQEVGAQLWHMSNISGPDVAIYNPNLDCAVFTTKQKDAYGVSRDQRANPLPGYNMILVGPDGTRFMSESTVGSHGRVNVSGEKLLLQFPTPMYVIFDEETRLAGKFTNTWESDDNSEMLPWATVADTIEELGEKMGMENLAAQVEEYNGFVRDGKVENVEVLSNYETPMVGSYAVNHMPERIVEAGTPEVDSITGCTISGNAIKQAVRNAIAQAEQA